MKKEIILKNFEEAMNGFDFEKVHSVMEFLDWGWGVESRVPTVGEMKETCYSLINGILESDVDGGTGWGTGGFKVYVGFCEETEVNISFMLEESLGFDYDE